MYKVYNGQCPTYLKDDVKLCSTLSGRSSLRSSTNGLFEIPRTNLLFGERAFAVAGPKAWNSLPLKLRNASSLQNFKKQLKAFLFPAN